MTYVIAGIDFSESLNMFKMLKVPKPIMPTKVPPAKKKKAIAKAKKAVKKTKKVVKSKKK